jgi:hypothetical protein
MQDKGKRPIPMEEIEVDRLPCMNQRHSGNHRNNSRQTGESCKDSLCPGGTEPRNEKLKHGTQQKRTRRNENQVRSYHA